MNLTKIEVPASLFPTVLRAFPGVAWERETRHRFVLRIGTVQIHAPVAVALLARHGLKTTGAGDTLRVYRLAPDGPNWPPVVGMPATVTYGSDWYPATVVTVSKSSKRIGVREDQAIRVDFNGLSPDQIWHFEPDESAPVVEYSLRKRGDWVRVGSSSVRGVSVALGIRQKHDDPHF